jgi:hypothetical protein
MKNTAKVLLLIILMALLPACHLSSWLTYTNTAYGFELQYPPGGSLATGATDTAVRIDLPITPGTNLVEKYLEINVTDGAGTCESPLAAGYAPGTLTPTNLVINGNNFARVSASEGAAGSFYEWTAYSTVNGSVCVSLTFVLHSHNPGVYSTPPPTFDGPGESAVFNLIVETFAWLEGAAITPTPSDWLTYTNLAYGFQLQYPPGGGGLQPGDTATSARIDLPFEPGTSLVEKYLAIEVEDGAATCSASLGPGGPTPVPLIIGGLSWSREPGAEGAAGSIFIWTTYSTASGSVCVHLTFDLHSESADVSPTPIPTYDEAAESAVFMQIVETFLWLDGAAVTPTPVPTGVPISFFFVPNKNAYCRLGPDPIFNAPTLAMQGESYRIDGRNLENTWLYIMIQPDYGCWVPIDSGTPSGDTSLVRVLNAIPTPTFTPPPFDCGQFTDLKACEQNPQCRWNRQANSCLKK